MRCARVLGLPALLLLLAGPVLGQGRWTGRTAVLYESYNFDTLLVFDRVSEMTVPFGLSYNLGRLGNIALSSGYARVDLRSTDTTLGDQQLSGLLDTEARLSVNLVPGKLVMLVTGAVPTGIKTVQQKELAILGALSSDVVGFAASNLGSGGNVGGGLVGAFPLGRWAAGFGATFRQPMGYAPVLGEDEQLKPGSEIRLRAGLEGPLARRTYVRTAAILARTSKDRIAFAGADSTRNGVGNRLITYLSVNQGIRSFSLTAYVFDVLRGDPQMEPTAVGAAVLPRGNVLALGGRLDVPLGGATTVTPNAEWRASDAAPNDTTTALERLGTSLRYGVDVRHRLTRSMAVVFQGAGTSGYIVQAGDRVNLSGYRVGLHLELTP
ncbi:MAG: hypothetical protein A3K13_09300 [Gemmatimonadetes bacterium RIFCSPLOWO2_12_FULL_68_9]|nr:MAG: hypothetical protein A3K13_09300 [Gemmatimonadetes bacterium RIFCSPLOWO2_12_FULL_68_9]